jgi:hypothetical protein
MIVHCSARQPRVAELTGMALALGGSGVWRHGGGCLWCVSVSPLSAIHDAAAPMRLVKWFRARVSLRMGFA